MFDQNQKIQVAEGMEGMCGVQSLRRLERQHQEGP